jgi:AcrR family transcriptional regulator
MLSLSTYITSNMLTVSTPARILGKMPSSTPRAARAPKKKRAYHHGDLERALVDTALQTIQDEGVQGLTLRSVGARVGVSRTALYRHFDGKAALLARVAEEGFRRLHAALTTATAKAAKTKAHPLQPMAAAYVRFARANPSHYQTMFGGFLTDWSLYPDLIEIAEAAFNVLVDAIREEQRKGRIAPGDAIELAEINWSMCHGIATLGMARHLERTPTTLEQLAVLASRFLQDGMRP